MEGRKGRWKEAIERLESLQVLLSGCGEQVQRREAKVTESDISAEADSLHPLQWLLVRDLLSEALLRLGRYSRARQVTCLKNVLSALGSSDGWAQECERGIQEAASVNEQSLAQNFVARKVVRVSLETLILDIDID